MAKSCFGFTEARREVRVEIKIEDRKRDIIKRLHNMTGNIYETFDYNVGRYVTSLNVWVVLEVGLRDVLSVTYFVVAVVHEWSFVQ